MAATVLYLDTSKARWLIEVKRQCGLANAGHHSIWSLADECGVTLVLDRGAAWIDDMRKLHYDPTLSLGEQVADVCAVLAADKYPDDALSRAAQRTLWVHACLDTLGPELASKAFQVRRNRTV